MARWRWHGAALGFYAAISWLFLDHGASLTGRILGSGTDPSLIMWFLAWWPWALVHHAYPLFTKLVWQPVGLNLAWTTCVPLLALLGLPFTLISGPVLAYNVLTLAAPVLAAWAAYFLCLRITRVTSASLIGGYLFGFSAYEMAQSNDHLNLDFTVLLPCLVLVVLARCEDRLPRVAFIYLATLLIAAQFLISFEICATMLVFAGLAWLLAYILVPEWRVVLRPLVQDTAITGAFVLLILAPVLRGMFAVPHDIQLPPHWPVIFSTDLLNLVTPTVTSLIGSAAALPVSRHFTGFPDEQDGYFGILLLAILGRYFVRNWGEPRTRFLAAMLGTVVVASLGPQLWLGGVKTHIPLPWALAAHLPLIGNALPARFMLYATLVVATTVALWVAGAPAGLERRRKIIWASFACLMLLPFPHWSQAVPSSAFFQPGNVEKTLGAGARILILPFGIVGPSSFWQAESQFGFAQTGGYLGYPPGVLQRDRPMMRLYFGQDSPNLEASLAAYCAATGTQYVVAGPGTMPWEMAALKGLDWRAQKIDDVTVFTVPQQ